MLLFLWKRESISWHWNMNLWKVCCICSNHNMKAVEPYFIFVLLPNKLAKFNIVLPLWRLWGESLSMLSNMSMDWNNKEMFLWWRYFSIFLGFKTWDYAQIYLHHSDFSSLFRTLVYSCFDEAHMFILTLIHNSFSRKQEQDLDSNSLTLLEI